MKPLQLLFLILGLSTSFGDSSKAMDPKEDLWQDMIGIAESRAHYNQVVHNIYTDWQKKDLTPDLKEQINNFTQQLMNLDCDIVLDTQGVFDIKKRNEFTKNVRIHALQKLPLDSLKNKMSWEFFARSLKAFKTPQERMVIGPRLVEELEFLRAENLGAISSKLESSSGLEQDEFTYSIVLLGKIRRYTEQAPLRDNGFGMTLTHTTEKGSMQRDLSQEESEKQISSWFENGIKSKRMSILPERIQKLEEKRGFATRMGSFVNKYMTPISDQLYVDHVLEFLSNYVIQPDINHLNDHFPRQKDIQRPALDPDEWLPASLTKPKSKKPVLPKKLGKKRPPPAKATQKKKTVQTAIPSAKTLHPTPVEESAVESTKPIREEEKLESNPSAPSPIVKLPPPPAPLQEEIIIPVEEENNYPLKQELQMAFTNASELEGYLAVFGSKSDRAHVNFEDLAKGKRSLKNKKSDGLSWETFEKFLRIKGWAVDESLSKGSSVSFIPPPRFASLTGLTPKRINVHKPKDTKISLYEGYLKFFRSGFESMGLSEQSLSAWLKVL